MAELTNLETAVLAAMSHEWPGSSPAELASAAGMSDMGVVRVAAALVRKGLATREYRLGLVHYWRHGGR